MFALLLKDQELDFLYPKKERKVGKVRLGRASLDDSDADFEKRGKIRFGSDDLGDSDDDYDQGHDDRLDHISPEDLHVHVIANKKETNRFQVDFEGSFGGGMYVLSCLRWFEAMNKDTTSSEEFMEFFNMIMEVIDRIPDRVLPPENKQTLKKCHEKLNTSKTKEKQKKDEKVEKGTEEKGTMIEKNNEKAGAKKGEDRKGGPDLVVTAGAPFPLVKKVMDLGFEPVHKYVLDKLKDFKKSKMFAILLKDQELRFLYPKKERKVRKVRLGGASLDDSDDDFEKGGKIRFGSDDLGDSDDDYDQGHDDRLDHISPEDLYVHVIANKKETNRFQVDFESFLGAGMCVLSCLRWFEAMKKENTSYVEFMESFAMIMEVIDGILDRVLPIGSKQSLKAYHDKFKSLDLKAATQKAAKKNF
ncbi:hypothetical protein MHU86_20581 [Fragilaria crotonensis]|nr:hypothetical protein MHU86_20581 [Fragilaria crotonensis]